MLPAWVSAPSRRTWQVHLCLQCPFSKAAHALLPALREEFGREYDIEVVLMALPWFVMHATMHS